jgi:DNA-binding winged helix-turn-helix (wHTH) protein
LHFIRKQRQRFLKGGDAMTTIHFPPWRLDLAQQRLWRGAEEIRLRAKTFGILCHLAERPGRLVTKEELLAAFWPHTYVCDIAPMVCVWEIRKALGPEVITTVYRRGYRFAGRTGSAAALSPSSLPAMQGGDRNEDLATLKRHIAELQASDEPIGDWALDALLGLAPEQAEDGISLGDLLLRYGQHRVALGDLPYAVLRDLFRRFELPPGSTLLDLGSGYGRVAFYGHLLTGIRVYGIELVAERVAEARRIQQRLGLSGLNFLCGDALTTTWPETTHYCLLNAFASAILPRIVERLEKIARQRRIAIASVSTSNLLLERQPWLHEIGKPQPPFSELLGVRIFASR